MSTPNTGEQVRWQDLKVRSELDTVLEIAEKEGWEDCEVFGYGDMITEPQESKGWELVPADLYKYSIPPEAVGRLHRVVNAGVRVKGVIIADDQRRTEPAPEPPPARPGISLPSIMPVLTWIGRAFAGLIFAAGIGILVAGALSMAALIIRALAHLWPVIPIGLLLILLVTGGSAGTGVDYDPKLVILVDDGRGGTTWVSLFTWYD